MANKKQERRTSQVNFRLTKGEYALLKKYAEERGYTSVSSYVRNVAVYEYSKLYENLKLIPEISKKLDDLARRI